VFGFSSGIRVRPFGAAEFREHYLAALLRQGISFTSFSSMTSFQVPRDVFCPRDDISYRDHDLLNPEEHSRYADQLIRHVASDLSLASRFQELDFSYLKLAQVKEILKCTPLVPANIGRTNCLVICDWLTELEPRIAAIGKEAMKTIHEAVPVLAGAGRYPQTDASVELRPASAERISRLSEAVAAIREGMASLSAHCDETTNSLLSMKATITGFQRDLHQTQAWIDGHGDGLSIERPTLSLHRNCSNILKIYSEHLLVKSSPPSSEERLYSLLVDGASKVPWSLDSGPDYWGYPSITMKFTKETAIVLSRYRVRGLKMKCVAPNLQSWILYGEIQDEWQKLDEQSATNILDDGETHDISIQNAILCPMTAIRLCMSGRNRRGSRQMHLTEFTLIGDVIGPYELIDPHRNLASRLHQIDTAPMIDHRQASVRADPNVIIPEREPPHFMNPSTTSTYISPSPSVLAAPDLVSADPLPIVEPVKEESPAPIAVEKPPKGEPPVEASLLKSCPSGDGSWTLHIVKINEKLLFPEEALAKSSSAGLSFVTSMTGLHEVRNLGTSRFGAVRLIERRKANGIVEQFAAKYYNANDGHEGLRAFQEFMKPLTELSHPHVMPIVGIIPPTKTTGPIILTPYSPFGSLDDVLNQVRLNDPPRIWNDATKLRMIVSLISGLAYLHNNGIIHHELKPRDLIVDQDGSIRICGYATSLLEEHRFTRATQVGGPSYLAPEIYNEQSGSSRFRDPKTDVYSFGLILHELLFGIRVFPSSMPAAMIMRRSMSSRTTDRPKIPNDVHPVLREMITRCWVPIAAKRPAIEDLWKRMQGMKFNLFLGVEIEYESDAIRHTGIVGGASDQLIRVDQFLEVNMLVNYPLKLLLRGGEKVKMHVSKSWPLRMTIMGIYTRNRAILFEIIAL
jgi:hypothetical protein